MADRYAPDDDDDCFIAFSRGANIVYSVKYYINM